MDYQTARNVPCQARPSLAISSSWACPTIRDSIGRGGLSCRIFHTSCIKNAQKGCDIIQQNQRRPKNTRNFCQHSELRPLFHRKRNRNMSLAENQRPFIALAAHKQKTSPKNIIGFNSRKEAIKSGTRLCKRCKP